MKVTISYGPRRAPAESDMAGRADWADEPVSRGRKGKNKNKTAKSARQPVALDRFSAPDTVTAPRVPVRTSTRAS